MTIRYAALSVALLTMLIAARPSGAQLPVAGTPPPMTLWRFLGIPQGVNKIRDATVNRRGNFPGLERKPPLKALADPSNLESDNPAIKKAAEIKQEEDLAPQKIKALKYLAEIGCGCYPGVKEALMAALDDCTEKVRYQAAKQIGKAAENNCEFCSKNCCCDEEMTAKLAQIAYERDDKCCWLEPSERVREAAREAMEACCRSAQAPPGAVPVVTPPSALPPEVVPDVVPPEVVPDSDLPPAPPSDSQTRGRRSRGTSGQPVSTELEARYEDEDSMTVIRLVPAGGADNSRRPVRSAPANQGAARRVPGGKVAQDAVPASQKPRLHAASLQASSQAEPGARKQPARSQPLEGTVMAVDQKTGTVQMEFARGRAVPRGARVKVNHEYAFKTSCLGELEIVFVAKNGRAIGQPIGDLSASKIAKGDQVMYYRPAAPTAAPEGDSEATQRVAWARDAAATR